MRALLVEDNPGDARLLQAVVAEVAAGRVSWVTVERLSTALHQLRNESFDVILLDLSLPDAHGLETFTKASEHASGIPIVVLTGTDDEELAVKTVQAGAQDYLVKGHTDGHLVLRAMRYAIERCQLLARERERSEQLKLSVREAHHRIKNNLQAISDLLYLELTHGENGSPEEALRESIDRVQAIATVHDLLSQDEDVRVVDARAVMDRLVPMVLHSGGVSSDRVTVRLDVQSIPLSSKRATVLALIVNELVSNAVKHAFKARAGGELDLSLRQDSEELVLRVRDNGPGLPESFSMATDSHVGLDVVRTLAERDLNGCFTLTSQRGVLAEVRFVW
jgi:two-component sensor histidine kinase